MPGLKLIGGIAIGLAAGATLQFVPSNPAIADGGGIAGGAKVYCPADIAPAPDGNGIVNVDDLLAVINAWGACPVPCDASGTWVNAAGPSYLCAGGIVNFNIADWTFDQTGSALTVMVNGAGLLDEMTGTITDCEAGGTFTVSKVAPSNCTVTYTLSGTFSSPTQFTGTFTVSFTGFGCQNCVSQSFNISATKQ